MKLKLKLSLVLFFFCFASVDADADAIKRKKRQKRKQNQNNILLLLTDDQDIILGSFNTKKYMPILHKQIKEYGITFEQGALTHVPICCPSRSSILTGKYLHSQPEGSMAINNSITGNCYGQQWKSNLEKNSTFAVYAQQAGYTTFYAGKYLNQYHYNSSDPMESIPNGWDYWYGLEGNSRYYNYSIVEYDEHSSKMMNGLPKQHKHADKYPDDYLPLVLQNYTLDKLASLPEPWLAVIAWPTPHGPFTPEPKYDKDYPNVIPPGNDMPNYNATTDSMESKHWLLRQLGIITNHTANQIDDIYRNRLRSLKTVDNHIGKIIDLLKSTSSKKKKKKNKDEDEDDESTSSSSSSSSSSSLSSSTSSSTSVLDRTVIIYTSDNGFQFGQHRLAIDKRHLYEHDVRVPFVLRGPSNLIQSSTSKNIANNITISKDVIVSLIDIAPTILTIILDGLDGLEAVKLDSNNDTDTDTVNSLQNAIKKMDGHSFWNFLQTQQHKNGDNSENNDYNDYNDNGNDIEKNEKDYTKIDPFVQRTDLLISYHGEGDPKCNISECPPPYLNNNQLWWMPDSYNNTYHCVRTITRKSKSRKSKTASKKASNSNSNSNSNHGISLESTDNYVFVNTGYEYNIDDDIETDEGENSIYCIFYDDENFVEYYDLNTNPYQLGNDYKSLNEYQIQRYEKRLQELLQKKIELR